MKNRKFQFYMISIMTMISVLFTGCTTAPSQQEGQGQTQEEGSTAPISATSFKLNTVVTITIYDSTDETLLDRAFELCDYYENIYSRTKETSELYKLNHRLVEESTDKTGYVVSQELADIIVAGIEYGALSKGNFDISIAPVSSLWDFTSSNSSVPNTKDIEAALSYVNYKDISVDGDVVTLKDGMAIDLGAIAKGYIADRIKDFLLSEGVKSAMINLGGNVLCVGEKVDGSPFRIGIQKPFADRNETISVMEIKDKSVVSSGIYERYFMQDDILYHHILNPKTGFPYNNDLVSVTIISDLSVDGDGLSTSCFALGLEDGLALINSLEDVQAVFITSDYELHYSDNFFEEITVIEQ